DKIVTRTTTGATLAEFSQLLAQLRAELEHSNLDDVDAEAVRSDLRLVEQMSVKPQAKGVSIVSRLDGIKNIIESAANIGAASVKLAPMVERLAEVARQLFN